VTANATRSAGAAGLWQRGQRPALPHCAPRRCERFPSWSSSVSPMIPRATPTNRMPVGRQDDRLPGQPSIQTSTRAPTRTPSRSRLSRSCPGSSGVFDPARRARARTPMTACAWTANPAERPRTTRGGVHPTQRPVARQPRTRLAAKPLTQRVAAGQPKARLAAKPPMQRVAAKEPRTRLAAVSATVLAMVNTPTDARVDQLAWRPPVPLPPPRLRGRFGPAPAPAPRRRARAQ